MAESRSRIAELMEQHEAELLEDWLKVQQAALIRRRDLIKDPELRDHSTRFLTAVRKAAKADPHGDILSQPWSGVRELLNEVSRTRAKLGFTSSETATFIFSFKQPLFARLRRSFESQPERLAEELWVATTLLDKLGLYTTELYMKSREEVIARQQAEMLELSTPVVELWQGVLALPLIGTLDSTRTQTVMEALLQRIVETGSEIAIIDITGVPTVDTLTAQHLIKTITATRLMGADCIISGIRPQIAQTIVHLGVNLGDVLTKSTMAGALELALKRVGLAVGKRAKAHAGEG